MNDAPGTALPLKLTVATSPLMVMRKSRDSRSMDLPRVKSPISRLLGPRSFEQ
jgi:hypothetical protein